MPITFQDIKEHYEQYGLRHISDMSTAEYKQALADGAFFWIDHHDFVRSTLSEEILATNREQLDAMIDYLQSYRDNTKLSSE
ncbi:TPA: hypothetical protein ACXP04_003620 [Klebsiella variicola subsp. variicola]|uniref:hypothetical protein n=1 Tax=Klebsiella pneumoniae complex TaxID=3390273 RepID=UPI000B411657|nr:MULTISPECIES: hypothetical protein [Klebsiella]MDP0692670.1 hypothetical protein [Klebsiella pneumoniae]MDP0769519.1 hypothetical protein [Klebsiella pneumoniae]RNT49161.1 hypothetical protein B9473_001540 [Klebsiella quasipneumoniae subsp. quasipneumoniae]HBQ3013219.1 hypothetical protein [Klebsiella quasipneumoniae subsp. quasipneumoniae]HBY8490264.1 hypothetical protein [Klebsiella pneumoniae]